MTFLVVLASFAAFASSAAAQSNDYIISFNPGTSQQRKAAAAAQHGVGVRFNYRIVNAIAVRVPNENALRRLQQESDVLSITPDFPVFATQSANAGKGKPGGGGGGSSLEVVPAGVLRVGAPADNSAGSGIGVAIVDTGIDLGHADLAGRIGGGFNAISTRRSCQDDNGHGTHVAGTVAAVKDNGIDVVGVAPGAKLFCVKVLNAQGTGSWSTIIAGLDWIADYNASNPAIKIRVINMSLSGGGSDSDSPLRSAIEVLHDSGVITVVAAGNDPSLNVSQQVPAAYARSGLVITVASTTAKNGTGVVGCPIVAKDTASYFTSNGVDVTISAPGEEDEAVIAMGSNCYVNSTGILSLKWGGGTTRMSGTSMAAPHVSGIVARLLQAPNSYAIPNAPKTVDIRNYFSGSLGADGLGCRPIQSPALSASTDTVLEGIAIIKAKEVTCN
jgi:subtilisin